MTYAMFGMDDISLAALRKIFQAAPSKLPRATAMVLNSFAFGSRDTAISVLPEMMTIRSKGFVKNRLRYKKTAYGPVESQQSEMGSIPKGKFTGWLEQETGAAAKRKKIATLAARRRSKKRTVLTKFRFNKKFMSPDRFKGRSFAQKVAVMMETLRKENYTEPFLSYGHPKMHKGLYEFNGTKHARLVVDLMPKQSKLQPERNPWMQKTRDRYFAKVDIYRIWMEALRRTFAKR